MCVYVCDVGKQLDLHPYEFAGGLAIIEQG